MSASPEIAVSPAPAPPVSSPNRPLTHADVLAIALPITLSNATTPLVGFADTVVIGQLGQAHLIGGVAVASAVFNYLYWAFGFLRMGTTGMTAQAVGAENLSEVAANLLRAIAIALAAGIALVVLQSLLAFVAFGVIGASAAVESAGRTYFDIRIWAAPAGLVNFALLGWFIGLGRTGLAFWIQLFLNGLNVLLAVVFVIALGWGVAGVAVAALMAEWLAAFLGLVLAYHEARRRGAQTDLVRALGLEQLKRALQVNGDIMIRTLSALAVFMFFMAQGVRGGDLTLAANAVLYAMASIAIYLLDGFAFAAETLVGQAVGAGSHARFRSAVRLSTVWAGMVGLALTALIWLAGPGLIAFMTTSTDVRAAAHVYLPWAALTPIVGIWCFQLDGIFIGATRTADMRNMMLLSVAIFFAAWALLAPWGNHGLWASMVVFWIARALTLAARYPSLDRAVASGAIKP